MKDINCLKCNTILVIKTFRDNSIGFECPGFCEYNETDLKWISDEITKNYDLKKSIQEKNKHAYELIVLGSCTAITSSYLFYALFANICGGTDYRVILKILTAMIGTSIFLVVFGSAWAIRNFRVGSLDIYWLKEQPEEN